MTDKQTAMRDRALGFIAACEDVKQLRTMGINALKMGEPLVERAARRRLYDIMPSAQPGTLEHDMWRSIHGLEDALTTANGKTTRLGRTRLRIKRDGEQLTLVDQVTRKEASEGFALLLEHDMAEYTFERVALRHADRFEEDVIAAATTRLGTHAATSTQ